MNSVFKQTELPCGIHARASLAYAGERGWENSDDGGGDGRADGAGGRRLGGLGGRGGCVECGG